MLPSITAAPLMRWLSVLCLLQPALGFADFGTITQPFGLEPTITVPRPHQLPDDVWMRYAPFQSHITAVAPSVRSLSNGSYATSWSMHFHVEPTRTVAHPGLRRRGVLAPRGILPPITNCRQCDINGNPVSNSNSTDSGSPSCSVVDYEGVFRSGGFSSTQLPDYCFDSGYAGPLLSAQPTDASLPCCPQCYPAGANSTAIITTGVLSTSGTIILPGGITGGASTITTNTAIIGGVGTILTPGGSTVTITATATEPVTLTQSTLSIETITPTNATETPVTTSGFNTIIGCGTARGCGTVVGSGTVYIAPFGFPGVTSSGTVSGCAPTVVGCGTMLATTGTFTGTVWPAGFMDMISFVSSGTVTGSGRVKGCGYLTGTGTFTVSEPFTTTSTPGVTPTVNVYVSYCPPEAGGLMRLAGNGSDSDSAYAVSPALIDADGNGAINGSAAYPSHATDAFLSGARNYTAGNFTAGNFTSGNGTSGLLCHVCPQDSGICCPPYTDCGSDGHCPWSALVGCGYARFGVNLVDVRNSSTSLGMGKLPEGNGLGLSLLRAPGLPGSKKRAAGSAGVVDGVGGGGDEEAGLTDAQKLRRRIAGVGGAGVKRDGHEHKHDHLKAHKVGLAHVHGR